MKRHALHLLLHYCLYLLGEGKHASHFSDEHLHLCYFYYRLLIILTEQMQLKKKKNLLVFFSVFPSQYAPEAGALKMPVILDVAIS